MRAGTISLPMGTVETAWWGSKQDTTPTLVLLHEGLGCIALWRDFPERLTAATGCGVFAWSRFGYGQSDPTPLPRPMDYMQREAMDVLPALLAAAGIRQAVLIGHSDGGSIASAYAGAAPDGLLGLITIAAHFFVEDLTIASIEQIKQDYDAVRPRLARYHRDVDIAFRGWNDAWLDPRFRGFNLTGYLPNIRVPVLALQGTDDPYGTDAQLHVMREHVRAPIEIALIPNARHAPDLEAPSPTLAAITRFIAAQRERAL
jgi:pimeloyl-ACP methyl ester carboxylesterase